MSHKRARLLLTIASIATLFVNGQNATERDNFKHGNVACPCLTNESISDIMTEDLTVSLLKILGDVDPYTYGIGCGAHDAETHKCRNGDSCAIDPNLAPQPNYHCDHSSCGRNFCYIDPKNCSLLNRRSLFFPNSDRFYSYATCWDVDSFVSEVRILSLAKRVFKVGFNSNSGGWVGAYRNPRLHFEGPTSLWGGPTVDFAVEAAKRGDFQLMLTAPPEFLRNGSTSYFGGSSFDFCVYATSLGYLDFCLAQYTITDIRASTTDWLVLNSQDLNLVVQLQDRLSNWDSFKESLSLIFAPFKVQTWMFIIFFVIPFLGILMVVHEYNHPGSSYPEKHFVIVKKNNARGVEYVEERGIPLLHHVARAMYINLLSVLQQNYVHTVVSYGAMMNLLGVSFFILTIIAVYTANLAAILTQQAQKTSIASLEEALAANYRICSERKNLETVRSLYPEIEDRHLVVDPVSLGGDGLPGFACANCSARSRVFDFLDLEKANTGNKLYCHAAFAPLEDLEVEQTRGSHCNKTIIGTRVGQVQTGIPVYEGVSQELISYFLNLKNDGVFDRLIKAAQPSKNCPKPNSGGEGSALSIAQLTGIWIVSFGFALLGLLVTCCQPRIDRRRKENVQSVHQYDQTGHRINILDKDDGWITSQSIVKRNKRIFVGDVRWGQVGPKHGSGSTEQSTALTIQTSRHLSGPGMRTSSITPGSGHANNAVTKSNCCSLPSDDESNVSDESVKSFSDDACNSHYPKEEVDTKLPPYRSLPPLSLPEKAEEATKKYGNIDEGESDINDGICQSNIEDVNLHE